MMTAKLKHPSIAKECPNPIKDMPRSSNSVVSSNARLECSHQSRQGIAKCTEHAFLKRDFRRALRFANQFLRQQTETVVNDEMSSDFNPKFRERRYYTALSLSFEFDSTPASVANRQFRIGLDLEESPHVVDQMAAIALQSWHEISINRSKNCSKSMELQDDGYRYLVPFFEYYYRTNVVMSPELMVIFIRFCRLQQHIKESILLSLEFLLARKTWRSSDTNTIDSAWEEDNNNEVLYYLLTSCLPYLDDPMVAREAVQVLLISNDPPSSILSLKKKISSQTVRPRENESMHSLNVEAASQILRVLEKVPELDMHRKYWAQTIRKSAHFFQNMRNDTTSAQSTDLSDAQDESGDSERPSLSSPFLKTRYEDWRGHFLTTIHDKFHAAFKSLQKNPKRWESRGKLAFSLAMIVLAWRRKYLVTRLSKSIVIMLLSPIIELLEAVPTVSSTTTMRGNQVHASAQEI